MKPDTPMLMITLQIPLTGEIQAEEVLEAIGEQLAAALEAVRQQQAEENSDAEVDDTPRTSPEMFEPYTEQTSENLLSTLGYDHEG